ncbi:unnamed protein product [Auanema sp. JU1783]|nr:unnamed protein product [Auanema sp. JU1783]
MSPIINYAEYFCNLLESNTSMSTASAAIETLYNALCASKATTVTELNSELDVVVTALAKTDHSSTSIRSASDLFRRFISLAPANLLDQPDFSRVLEFYKERGRSFIERVGKSRALISNYSQGFLMKNTNILTHSYSKVVLEALVQAKNHGINNHVWVTQSQPDQSGIKMHQELKKYNIKTTLILDSCVGYIMERVDIVVVGAEGVMETGGIINKIGTLSLSVCAKTMNKPVYVMAESIKFVKEYPLNQSDIPQEFKYRTSVLENNDLAEEHPLVDYTSPQYINLLFTDLGILTPAAVGEELIKLYI